MSPSIKPQDLGKALSEMLTTYHAEKLEKVNAAGERAIKKLLKRTKATAPENTGAYAKSLTYTAEKKPGGDVAYTWGASGPQGRLTHLLVDGHATVDGGRVPGDPFLESALDTVIPEYESDVEEAMTE